MKTTIIVPCYNEEQRLKTNVFIDFCREQKNQNIHFLFVNDGSKDATVEVLKTICDADSHLAYFNLEKNEGKAQAVRAGVLYAMRESDSDLIGYWDADLATPLDEIPRFIALFETNKYLQLAMGSRILRLGGKIERKWRRFFLGRIFATIVSILLGLPVYDTQCGAKLFRKEKITDLFQENFCSPWFFDVEILFRLIRKLGIENAMNSIYEIPLNRWKDEEGSKLKATNFLTAPFEIFKIYRRYQ